jgi:hypothetical protein
MPKRDNLDAMEKIIKYYAGKEAAARIMVGRDTIKKSTSPEKAAEWMKTTVDRMDDALDGETRQRIMIELGYNCAEANRRVVKAAVSRRGKYGSLEAFVEAEMQKPQKGTRLERDGDRLIHVYAPKSWIRPMRCYCGFINKLPEGVYASPTYCGCGRGFIERYWEAVASRPVRVELLGSCISGADECRFAVYL